MRCHKKASSHCALITTQVTGAVNCREATLSGGVPWVGLLSSSVAQHEAPGTGVCTWGLAQAYRAWINNPWLVQKTQKGSETLL